MPEQHRMSLDEIKEFVMGVCDNKIWTDRHCRNENDVGTSFMILKLWSPSPDFPIDDVALIWEWMDKAMPWAVNGMPTFFSCRFMMKDDWEICRELIDEEMNRRDNMSVRIQQKLNLRDSNVDGNQRRDPAVSNPAKEERDRAQGYLRGLEAPDRGNKG